MEGLGDLIKSVVFVLCSWGTEEPELRGTGFFVGVRPPGATGDEGSLYVVTAGHVVRPFAATYIRLTLSTGLVEDREIARDAWVFHDYEDVAVAPLTLEPDTVDGVVIVTDLFVGTAETDRKPGLADDVFFAGLLGQVSSVKAG